MASFKSLIIILSFLEFALKILISFRLAYNSSGAVEEKEKKRNLKTYGVSIGLSYPETSMCKLKLEKNLFLNLVYRDFWTIGMLHASLLFILDF